MLGNEMCVLREAVCRAALGKHRHTVPYTLIEGFPFDAEVDPGGEGLEWLLSGQGG